MRRSWKPGLERTTTTRSRRNPHRHRKVESSWLPQRRHAPLAKGPSTRLIWLDDWQPPRSPLRASPGIGFRNQAAGCPARGLRPAGAALTVPTNDCRRRLGRSRCWSGQTWGGMDVQATGGASAGGESGRALQAWTGAHRGRSILITRDGTTEQHHLVNSCGETRRRWREEGPGPRKEKELWMSTKRSSR